MMLLEEVWPQPNLPLNILPTLFAHAFSVLGKIYRNRQELGEFDAISRFRSVLSLLVAKCYPHVREFTKYVSFQIEHEVISNVLRVNGRLVHGYSF